MGSKPGTIVYWIVTGLFCPRMRLTAYARLLPQVAEAFIHLGFPTGISGQALAGRAQAQAQKFGARLAIGVR